MEDYDVKGCSDIDCCRESVRRVRNICEKDRTVSTRQSIPGKGERGRYSQRYGR